jgi:hypothetical protein
MAKKKKVRKPVLRKAKKIRIDAVGFELSGLTKGKISLATDDGGRNLLNSRG